MNILLFHDLEEIKIKMEKNSKKHYNYLYIILYIIFKLVINYLDTINGICNETK